MTQHDDRPTTDNPGVQTSTRDGVRTLLLDRPPGNLLHTPSVEALLAGLRDADGDPDVAVVVLRGAGDEAFCGGADFVALQASGDPARFAAASVELFKLLPRLTKPIVAAVNGDALAGGFALATACDIVIAVEGSRLGTVEASRGIWPMVAQIAPLRRLPIRLVAENVFTGEPWPAARALELALVNAVVPGELLDETVASWADRVRVGGEAIATGRPLFWRLADAGYDESFDLAVEAFLDLARR